MAIDWKQLGNYFDNALGATYDYWKNPVERLGDIVGLNLNDGQADRLRSVRMSPRLKQQDIEDQFAEYAQSLKSKSLGELVGELNRLQQRGNFGRYFDILKEEALSRPNSLENQMAIEHRFGRPQSKPVPTPDTPEEYRNKTRPELVQPPKEKEFDHGPVKDVPQEFLSKTKPESIRPPEPPTYGPSVRVQTPTEFLNKPEQSTNNREELRPTVPEEYINYVPDEGARIHAPEEFLNKPKPKKKYKPKPIDLTSLPSFPKQQKNSLSNEIDRKRFALLDTYGDTGINSLNDDAYVQRKFNAAMRGSRAQQLMANYNRSGNGGTAVAGQNRPLSQPMRQVNMYRNMGQVAKQNPSYREPHEFKSKDYYRNLGLTPDQIQARDERYAAAARRRQGYKG